MRKFFSRWDHLDFSLVPRLVVETITHFALLHPTNFTLARCHRLEVVRLLC